MNELSLGMLGMLGMLLGCSLGLAGIFLGVRYSKVQSFGRLSKRVYLGIALSMTGARGLFLGAGAGTGRASISSWTTPAMKSA